MKSVAKNPIHTDVLVIGTGLAGCSAALAAAKEGLHVTLITSQQEFSESASYYAQGGIISPNIEDSLELMMQDFQRAGDNLVNEKAVETVYRYVKQHFEEVLINDINVPFDKTPVGDIHLTREASHSIHRIAHVKDHTGNAVQSYFYSYLKKIKI